MAFVRWVILALAAFVALAVWAREARDRFAPSAAKSPEAPRYQCPMHPEVVSFEPGECPICHMDLVPISAERAGSGQGPSDASPGASASSALPPPKPLVVLDDAGPLTFFCPMDTEVRSAKPGRCPICKMALEPIPASVLAAEAVASADAGHGEGVGHGHGSDDGGVAFPPEPGAAAPGSIPPGTTPMTLALDRIQSIGVRTAVAEESTTGATLRVTAIVEAPERGTAEIHVRTPGFVEAILVDETGREVRAGQPLFSLYSPEILQAERELLATLGWSGDAGGERNAARGKLDLLGVSPADVDRVVATREPIRAIGVATPRAGFVTKKNVVLGSYVTPEMVLYTIQDLSRVYVVADVFLRDVANVAVGTTARFVPTGRAGDATTGTIDLVYPILSAEARTRRVRMVLPNEGGRKFAPGQYGTVEIARPARRTVTIPRDALIDTGGTQYVFVVEPGGRFSPRVVAVAGSAGLESDAIMVAAGLEPGTRVVSGATFLVDSESRLQASIARASPHAPSKETSPPRAPAPPSSARGLP